MYVCMRASAAAREWQHRRAPNKACHLASAHYPRRKVSLSLLISFLSFSLYLSLPALPISLSLYISLALAASRASGIHRSWPPASGYSVRPAGLLYNARLSPLSSFLISFVVWYKGRSRRSRIDPSILQKQQQQQQLDRSTHPGPAAGTGCCRLPQRQSSRRWPPSTRWAWWRPGCLRGSGSTRGTTSSCSTTWPRSSAVAEAARRWWASTAAPPWSTSISTSASPGIFLVCNKTTYRLFLNPPHHFVYTCACL